MQKALVSEEAPALGKTQIQTIALDPRFPITLHQKPICVPDLAASLQRRRSSSGSRLQIQAAALTESDHELLQSSDDEVIEVDAPTKKKTPAGPVQDDYVPFGPTKMELLRNMPTPSSATRSATMQIQRALKDMLKLQDTEGPRKNGWYLKPPEDSIYQVRRMSCRSS